MKKKSLITAFTACLAVPLLLTSCGGDPASNNQQPESTMGDYIGHDDVDTTGKHSDTTVVDTARRVVQ